MSTYELLEVSLADTRRLLDYRMNSAMQIHLNIKGFNYAWILDSIEWNDQLRVLDVGAGYSKLPIFIANTFNCEVWAVDDFGLLEEGDFWERNLDPRDYIDSHPEIKYIIGRVGDPDMDVLPTDYFDVIYSASALEHVPQEKIRDVWQHMDHLLKPNGQMLHGLDIAFPTSLGWKHVGMAVLFDLLYPFVPMPVRRRFAYETPKSYLRQVLSSIKISGKVDARRLSVLKMVIDSEVVTEPLEHTYHRMVKDGQSNARYYRFGSLLLHLKKSA